MKKKPTGAKITVRGMEIGVIRRDDEDYISLTDIAKSRNPEHPDDLIRNWLRNRNTLELLDEVEFKFDRDPGGEFEGHIGMGVCAAVAARL